MWDVKRALQIDCVKESKKIAEYISGQVQKLKKDGAVVGVSGGIDSALSVKLCLKALGKNNIVAVLLPVRESDPKSLGYGAELANEIGVKTEIVDITSILQELGVYENRDKVFKMVF